MELTGKCLKAFEQWLVCSSGSFDPYYNDISGEYDCYKWFSSLPDSMQWGVLVDFFDENDIFIEICKMHLSECYYWMINDGDEENEHTTRQEARTEAIKKANEIYNSNK